MEIITTGTGVIGAIALTLAYLLLQFEYIAANTRIYNFMNLIGSSLILYSLFYKWNAGAALIEVIWILITLAAIFNDERKRLTKKDLNN